MGVGKCIGGTTEKTNPYTFTAAGNNCFTLHYTGMFTFLLLELYWFHFP